MRGPGTCDERRVMVSELHRRIAGAVRAGTSLDRIEEAIIGPADLEEDEKTALWLYADALDERHVGEREPALLPG
jgi:hypothetical protein